MCLAVLIAEVGGRHGALVTTALHQVLFIVGNIHLPLPKSVARRVVEFARVLWPVVVESYLKLSFSLGRISHGR